MMEGGHYRKFYISWFTDAVWHDNGGSHDLESVSTFSVCSATSWRRGPLSQICYLLFYRCCVTWLSREQPSPIFYFWVTLETIVGSQGSVWGPFGPLWTSLGVLLGSPGRSGPAEGFGPVSGRPQDAQKVVLHADLGPQKALIFRKRRGREDKQPSPKCTFLGRWKVTKKSCF